LDWKEELGRWLKPFLDRLGHKARRQMCPLYVWGLIGPGHRKSIQPMAERLSLGEYDQLHHFIAAGVWDAAPVETGGTARSAHNQHPPTRSQSVHFEVARNTDGPGKFASCQPLPVCR
jgi:SRSO17 transposase